MRVAFAAPVVVRPRAEGRQIGRRTRAGDHDVAASVIFQLDLATAGERRRDIEVGGVVDGVEDVLDGVGGYRGVCGSRRAVVDRQGLGGGERGRSPRQAVEFVPVTALVEVLQACWPIAWAPAPAWSAR